MDEAPERGNRAPDIPELDTTVEIRVYTHPACSGCTTAVRQAWSLGETHPEVAVRTVSLEREEGLAEARAESVRTIPTVVLATRRGDSERWTESRRWAGTPEPAKLEGAVDEVLAELDGQSDMKR